MGKIKEVYSSSLTASEFWTGVRDSIPLLVGAIPFGITCGIMAIAAGLSYGETLLMSILVFAGAAQFIAITMLGAGASGGELIVVTTLLVNLRHLVMGASLAPHIISLPVSLQAFLSFGMTDETYAITIERIRKKGYNPGYQLGVTMMFYSGWVVATAVGVLLSGYISDPLGWGLDFAMPAVFLAMLVPRLISPIALVVCGVAAIVGILGMLYLPGKWYIIVACLAAVIVGGLLEKENEYAS